ncbi:MAG TPA: transposase [Streptosporangiaceae bacterium]|jgi:transposase|nr:transposase [Streptosporangiaceae bacterium]
MAKRYRPVNRDQPYLFPPSMRDWLPPEHPVWLVITAVEEHMDTSAFHAGRKLGGAGTAGYDPDMLVTVLVWAYAHQVTSSRDIERLCWTDVAFRVICGGNTPRHVTVAEFRRAFPGRIGAFFAEVLALCARLGMGKLGVVALDGMKIAANASKSANRTEETLAKMAAQTVARHGETDAAEDDLFGAGVAGDEVPEDAWSPRRRDQRVAAALASLRAERQAAESERARKEQEHLADAAAGAPRRGSPPAGAAVELAAMKVERARAAQQAKVDAWDARAAAAGASGRKPRGPRPADPDSYVRVREARAELERAQARAEEARRKAAQKQKNRKGPGPVRNITDPDGRLMPVRGGGFIEGYNTQNVTSADGLVIATELTQDTTDAPWFEPMLRQAEDAAALITAHRPAASDPAASASDPDASDGDASASLIRLFLSDAGYLSEHNLTIPGPDRLIATGKTRDIEKAARHSADGDTSDGVPRASPHIAAMAARLATEDGIAAYRQRGHIAETPHGNIKHNMRFRQLSVRGKPKAAAEWTFTCAVHNLFKAITTGHLTTAALDRLASQAGYPPPPQAA